MKLKLIILILFSFFLTAPCGQAEPLGPFYQSLAEKEKFEEVKSFLDNVFKQLKSSDLRKIVADFKTQSTTFRDHELYEFIRKEFPKYKKWSSFLKQSKLLQNQQRILTDQTLQLLPQKTIENIVEIGTPGTFLSALRKKFSITGISYVLNSDNYKKDLFYNFSWRPFKGFKSYDFAYNLNDYSPITEDIIPSSSVEAVVFYTGLHHIPSEKLNAFIHSIVRILKPGGSLIVREYNCDNAQLMTLITTTHSLYNAIAKNIPFEEEQNEIRNFKPLQEWIEFMKGAGLKLELYNDQPGLLQDGDPTKNTLLKFTKTNIEPKEIPVSEDDIEESLSYDDQHQLTFRPLHTTFMTTTEWYSLDVSKKYGEFIDYHPFYEFPYFESVKTFWYLFIQSYKTARKHSGFFKIVFSKSMLTSLFVGTMMTLEYGFKGIITWPLRKFGSNSKDRFIDINIQKPTTPLDSIGISHTLAEETPETWWIKVPRYMKLLDCLQKLSEQDIKVHKIAGNELIQIKISSTPEKLKALESQLNGNAEIAYIWRIPSETSKTLAALIVKIPAISDVLKILKSQSITIEYLHDF